MFLDIDNEVVLEIRSYMKVLFSFVGAHLVFNLEYPKKLKMCFKFLKEICLWSSAEKENGAIQKWVR